MTTSPSYNTYTGPHPNNDPKIQLSENYLPYTGHMLTSDPLNEKIVSLKHTRMDERASFYWDRFYWKHGGKFFKDRHWMIREFFELEEARDKEMIMIEAGCGVGNAIFPLLAMFPLLQGRGFDFAKNAVNVAIERAKECHLEERTHFFVYDLSKDCTNENEYINYDNGCNQHLKLKMNYVYPLTSSIRKETPPGRNISNEEFRKLKDQGDFVTLIFVLSALSPEDFVQACANIKYITKPGGIVFIRDYAADDLAQERFEKQDDLHIKIQENFFARGDGTRAYYFKPEELNLLFADWECISNTIEMKEVSNVKRELLMKRRFIQCKFRKPLH